MINNIQIKVGQTVQAFFESVDSDASHKTLGTIVGIKRKSYRSESFDEATIKWEDGTEFSIDESFFFKTVHVVGGLQ
jgi:hypothetical protein